MVESGGNDRIIVDFDEEEPQSQSKDLMTFIRDLEDECRDLMAQKNSMISKHTPERAFRIAELRKKIAEREEQIRTQLQKNAEIELIKQNAEKVNPLGGENVIIDDGEVVHGGGLLALDMSNPGSTSTQADNNDDAKVASDREDGATAKLAQNVAKKTQLKRKYESVEGAENDKLDNKKPKQEPVKPFKFEFKKVGSSAGNGADVKMDVAAGVKENILKMDAGDKDVQDVAETQTSLPQKLSLLRLLIKDTVVLDRLLHAKDSKGCKSLTMPKDIENETMKKIKEIWKDDPSAGTQVLQYTQYIPTEYSQQGLDEKEVAFMKLISRFSEIIRSLVANDKMMEIPVGSLISLLDSNSMSLLRKYFTLKSFLQQGSDRGLIPKTFIKNGIAVLPLDLPKDEEKSGMDLVGSEIGASQKKAQADTDVPLDSLIRKPNMAAPLKYKQIKALLEIKHKISIPHYNIHADKSLLLVKQGEPGGNQTREPLILKSLNFWPSVCLARPYDLPCWMDNIFTGVRLCKPRDTSNKTLEASKENIANLDLGNSVTEVLGLLGSVFLDLRSKKTLDIESFTSAMKHQWDTKPGIRTSPLLLALMLRLSLLTQEQPAWQDEILGLLGSAPSYHGYIQAGYSFCPNIIRGTGGNYLKGAFIMISGAGKIAELSQSSEKNADIILDLSLHHVHLQTMVPLKSRSPTQFSELTASEQKCISTYYASVFTALSRYPRKLCILLACMAQHYIGRPLPESVVHHLGYPQPDQNPDSWCWRTRFPAKQSKFAMIQAQRILQQGLGLLGNNTFVRSATKEQQDAFNIPKEVAIAALRSCIMACQEKQNSTPIKKKNKLLTPKRKKSKKVTDKGQEPLALLQKCEQTSETVEPLYWPSNFFSDSEHASNFSKDNVIPFPFMMNIILEPRAQYNVRMISDLVAGIEFIDSELELKSLSDYIVTTMGNNPDASLLLVELLRRMAVYFQFKPRKASLQKTCFGYFLSVVVDSLWQAKPQVSEDVWMKAAMILRSVSQDSLSELILLCIERNQNNISFFQEICSLHSAINSKV